MQVVVELPRLVADPQVVRIVGGDVVEEHEVGEQDLVHLAPRLEDVEVVLAHLRLDVRGLVRHQLRGGVDGLACGLEHRGHGVLREPDDLEVRPRRAQLTRDREVALRVAEADGARDVERSRRAAVVEARHPPLARALSFAEELAQEQVDLDRVAQVRRMSRALERHERAARRLGEGCASRERRLSVPVSVDDKHGAANARTELARRRLVAESCGLLGRDEDFGRRLQTPLDTVLDLLRRVRLRKHLRDEELDEAGVVA